MRYNWILLASVPSSSMVLETPNNKNNTIGPAHSSKCDRRLSRAARRIVHSHMIPILSKYLQDENDWGVSTKYSRNSILTLAIEKLGKESSCSLSPKNDVLLHHEQSYVDLSDLHGPAKKNTSLSPPHLRLAWLSNISPKSTIFQFLGFSAEI